MDKALGTDTSRPNQRQVQKVSPVGYQISWLEKISLETNSFQSLEAISAIYAGYNSRCHCSCYTSREIRFQVPVRLVIWFIMYHRHHQCTNKLTLARVPYIHYE